MIKCIAIDDEPLALKQIESYIERTPFLELNALFDNALSAMEYLEYEQIDLIFVDINMPDLNGLDFVKSLKDAPGIVFTTAHSEYAIEGFKVDAIDYLLKPIAYPDFLKAANKAGERTGSKAKESLKRKDEFLFIKSEYKIIRINVNEIRYIEGMRDYLRIHLINKKPVMTLLSLKKIESALPADIFMRVHRSYIVNLKQIEVLDRMRIVFDDKVYIPVSDQYKERFQQYIDKNFLPG